MNTPDVTATDFGAVAALVAAKVAGLDGGEYYATCAVAAVVVLADAIRRHGRSQVCASRALVADQTGE